MLVMFVGSFGRALWVWVRLVTGIVLVVLGVLGLFLPILQGFLLLILGLVILGAHFHWARRLLDYVRIRKASRDTR
ncbi:MAG: PGPGW domain-containing protein [Terriglobia bacterium]